jgi:hypothetical protein
MPKGMPKVFKGFRFNSQLYLSFKELAFKNGYTVTGALEKFMACAVEFGLVFPSAAKTEAIELAEKRKHYSSLIRYYHQTNAQEEVIATFRSALNERINLESSSELYERVFAAIQSVKPENGADLLSRLFEICYESEKL